MDDTVTDETITDDFDDFGSATSTIDAYVSATTVTAHPSATLREAAVLLDNASVGCVVIGDTLSVEGVVSERDIVRAVAAGFDLDTTTVGDVETKALKWASPESSITDVAEEMLENYVRHVMVGDGGTLVGVVSMRDLLGALLT